MAADLILHGGPIHGAEGADALAVRCGKIVAVGKSSEILKLRGPQTRLFPLEGRPLLPGFFDGHVHFLKVGLDRTFFVDLSGARSLSEALEMLRARAEARPGEWVVGRGWGVNPAGPNAAIWSARIWIGLYLSNPVARCG